MSPAGYLSDVLTGAIVIWAIGNVFVPPDLQCMLCLDNAATWAVRLLRSSFFLHEFAGRLQKLAGAIARRAEHYICQWQRSLWDNLSPGGSYNYSGDQGSTVGAEDSKFTVSTVVGS